MNKLKRDIAITCMFTIICLFAFQLTANAALQANQNTQYTKTDSAENWMSNFRKMEAAGGAMGLSETLNEDLTSSSESNNIDVHMMRATEYGAIAILSASGYGNPSNDTEMITTTGNATGVMINGWEFNAAGGTGTEFSKTLFPNVNNKYYDTYSNLQNSARIGDALGNSTTTNPGCANWHLATKTAWIWNTGNYFKRGNEGVFSFSGNYLYGSTWYASASCRGVAVCGTGF